jgi:predicted alpha/beta-fold hydrolase
MDLTKANIGQEDDVKCLSQAIDQFREDAALAKKMILFGYSRGASTIINELGAQNHSHEDVGAIVLVAPFSSIEDVVAHKMGIITESSSSISGSLAKPFIPFSAKIVEKLIVPKLYPHYSPNGAQPIYLIGAIDREIPILIVHSQDDDLCPFWGAEKLCSELSEQGRDNVYFLSLMSCGHCEYPMNEGLMAGVVHAFYKKYGFVYDEKLAHGVDIDAFKL